MNEKDKQQQSQQSENAPIMLSNLDTNMLESFGEPGGGEEGGSEVSFTQNCVPFDFDGERLLWMQYLTRDAREVYLYTFDSKLKSTVATFAKRDGIISHMKFLGESLFYVKNTRDIVRYDMKTKSSQLVGTAKDAVIALSVTRNKMREYDSGEEVKLGGAFGEDNEIDEENKGGENSGSFTLTCLDESENLYVYKAPPQKTGAKKVFCMSTPLKNLGNIPQEMREKDLFGMGYPYYVTLYANYVAFSTDYGVVLVKFNPTKFK